MVALLAKIPQRRAVLLEEGRVVGARGGVGLLVEDPRVVPLLGEVPLGEGPEAVGLLVVERSFFCIRGCLASAAFRSSGDRFTVDPARFGCDCVFSRAIPAFPIGAF